MIVRKPLAPELSWFPEARFGLFIHFGLYSLLERGEWVMYNENIRREDYEPLLKRFNPRRFQAADWVQAAQESGCRYMTVTAKHHDGFCLFDSALTDFKITNTPFRRDLIGELAAACQSAGLPLVLYYSQPDWHHRNFVHRPGAFKDLQYARPDDEPAWDEYLAYYLGQVEELCTNYGPIHGIWFDGVQRTEQQWQGRRVYDLIKRLQPQAVVNDRAMYGDFFTPERSLVVHAAAAGYMVEACQSVAQAAWGYQSDTALYSTPELLHSMLRMTAAGGNYLLNLGPKADGSLPEAWLQRMREMGEWLRVRGDAVYATAGCPFEDESPTVLYTRRGQTLHLHLLQWPATDRVELTRPRRVPRSARLVGSNERLAVEERDGRVVVTGLPPSPPSALANVIALECGPGPVFRPRPAPEPSPVIGGEPGKRVVLEAASAARAGFGIKGGLLTLTRDGSALGPGWTPEQTATWTVELPAAGRYRIAVELSCPEHMDGTVISLRVGQAKLTGTVPRTDGQGRRVDLGELALPAGRSQVVLRPERMQYNGYFAVVRRLILTPIKSPGGPA